jgi:hypothetical protein
MIEKQTVALIERYKANLGVYSGLFLGLELRVE